MVADLASTSHAGAASAISSGLKKRQSRAQPPAYWIQISGATVYAADEIASGRFGQASEASYDDVKDQDRIIALIKNNPKRAVKHIVLSQPMSVKTALLIGPLIYGTGRGPVNQRSVQAPEIARVTLEMGHGFKLNNGENVWSNVHVRDVGSLVLLLVEAALANKDGLWNEQGVYNVENGKMVSDVSVWLQYWNSGRMVGTDVRELLMEVRHKSRLSK